MSEAARAARAARPRVAGGSDHAGFEMKKTVKRALDELGYEAIDFGTDSEESTDYPDFAHAVSRAVASGAVERGVLACGSGIGMSISANRHEGVRAALVWDPELAELARRHNDANVLVLPGRFIGEQQAVEALRRFLDVSFDGGRHERRIKKIER